MTTVRRSFSFLTMHENSGKVYDKLHGLINGAEALGLPYISVKLSRDDHFVNGGNVVKATSVHYDVELSDTIPEDDA